MTRLVLIRHGETDWNVIGRYQGQADPPLNSRGIAQAQELAEKISKIGIDLLYTSPLKRAHQTAKILSQKLDIPLVEDPRLMEIHQGDWQTRLRSEIEEKYPRLFRSWETNPWDVTPPGGEDLKMVQERVNQALDEILIKHPERTVGIVSHRIPIALIKTRFQGLDRDIVRTLHLPNTFFEIIDCDSTR